LPRSARTTPFRGIALCRHRRAPGPHGRSSARPVDPRPQETTRRDFSGRILMTEHDEATDLKLADVVDGFCRRLEEGADPDPACVLAEHPDLPDLAACLQGLAAVEELRGHLPAVADESRPDAEPEAPRLPNYEIVRELGRGGPGIVYEARDLRFVGGRRVAVKMIKAGALASPE